MAFTKSTEDLIVHQKMADYPVEDGQFTTEDLKKEFDRPVEALQRDLNKVIDELAEETSAGNLGAGKLEENDTSANNLQAKLGELNKRIQNVALGSIPNGSITEEKLDEEFSKNIAKKNGELQENLNSQFIEGKTITDLQGIFKGTVLTGSFTLTSEKRILDVDLGFKPDLVIVYSKKNNDNSDISASNSSADRYFIPRIITEAYTTEYSKINENGFKYGIYSSGSSTEYTQYYIAIKL